MHHPSHVANFYFNLICLWVKVLRVCTSTPEVQKRAPYPPKWELTGRWEGTPVPGIAAVFSVTEPSLQPGFQQSSFVQMAGALRPDTARRKGSGD